jgi:predicted transcriptional regulator
VAGLWLAGMFVAALCSYVCTEYMLVTLDAQRRVMTGEPSALLIILLANAVSFVVMVMSAMVLTLASGNHFYLEAIVICFGAQAIWLGQNLWSYYRDRLRMNYQNRSFR